MNIYYYNLIPIRSFYEKWKEKKIPGHQLYGLTEFSKYNIDFIPHNIPFNPYTNRLRLTVYSFFKIFLCKKKI
jgi:hypothetical protein